MAESNMLQNVDGKNWTWLPQFEILKCLNRLAIVKAMESDGDKATAVGCPSETVIFVVYWFAKLMYSQI